MRQGLTTIARPAVAWWLLFYASLPCSGQQAWQTNAGYRSLPLTIATAGQPGFTLQTESQTGIAFSNSLSDASAAANQIRMGGSGIALGDVDGDGRCDIYLCRLEGDNVLYRNLGGWRFEDITARARVTCPGQYSTGCALADVDGDGDLDLLVNAIGVGTRLFFNDGRGIFTESAQPSLHIGRGATSLALADVDGDGDLDLYVANYRTNTIRSTGLQVLNISGKRMIRPEDREQYEITPAGMILEHGDVDVLSLNDGRGQYAPVPWTGGAFLDEDGRPLGAAPKEWGLSAMFRDIDGDGLPDLYVCNDFWSPDRIWINKSTNGRVQFQAAPRLMLRQTSTFSMGVDFADLNRDGFDDFLVLDMLSRDHPRRLRQRSLTGPGASASDRINDRPQVGRNTLFVNRGDGTFAELAQSAGLQASEWSWGIVFLDVDLDGWEDALITTGHAFDTQDADTEARLARRGPNPNEQTSQNLLEFPRLHVPNCAFRNRGDLTFEDAGARWGFNQVGISHGLALADLDNDGDLDVVVNNLNRAVSLCRNDSPARRIAVRLNGRTPNTHGIGAKIKVSGGPVPQTQEWISGGRYLSCDEGLRVFAAGVATNLSIEVAWRSGARSVLTNLQPHRIYEIDEAAASANTPPVAKPSIPPPLFREVTAFQHAHTDQPFDDFARQPLLPRRLSQLGPGVSWIDIDGDGRDDLCAGSGRGGNLSIFRNRGDGGFEAMRVGGPLAKVIDDQTTILGWSAKLGTTTLLVGQANYETGDTNLPSVRRFEIAGAMSAREPLPNLGASPGPLAMADLDGDGDLDLFIGGRVIAGHYPRAAVSRLFRNEGGGFKLSQEWPALGLVSGAVFTDLDGDGLPELVLACEWGPVRVFANRHGKLTEATAAWGLDKFQGWWNGVAAGDFNGDGRLDLVASNWGRNTQEQPFLREGWRVHFGDLAGRGTTEIVEAILDRDHGRLAPWRDLDALAHSLPWLRERFTTSASFADASLEQILGDALNRAVELRVNWLDSTLFLNRGEHFEARPLPAAAQWAPAFAVGVADADGDGNEDVFLSQNFFAVSENSSRLDAGRGLWLRGDGRGGLAALSGAQSGVLVYGEQRGAALCDYDADGRIDLAVSQNGSTTKLFHNDGAKPGLRIRLRGPDGNLQGIGAVLRWGNGPAREVHGGSGYWSQDSAVTVLARPAAPARLTVRWPGGKVTSSELPTGANEITISAEGKVEQSATP